MVRKDVVRSVDEVVAMIQDGMTIAIGGLLFANHPMPIIRGLIRRKARNLTVIGPASAGLDIDLLVGAGCIKRLITPYVSGEHLVATGPCFRRACEQGEIDNWEVTEAMSYCALQAAALKLPFLPTRGGLGSSVPDLNPDIKLFMDPIEGKPLLAVPAVKPDITILHVQRADKYGNGQHLGGVHGDRLMALAADKVILTTDRLVSNEVIRRTPYLTTVPHAQCVVEVPFGSHPFSSQGAYQEDTEFLKNYVIAAEKHRRGESKGFQEFLETFVMKPADHFGYLELIGLRKLLSLQAAYDYIPVVG
jgi:glutaconate CoA-transferase subunit A